jgi:hypothetical protein
MTAQTRFEVLPDRDGGWSVTRDAIVLGQWHTQAKAMAYAAERARVATQTGGQVVVVIRRGDGRVHSQRRFGRKTREKLPGAL